MGTHGRGAARGTDRGGARRVATPRRTRAWGALILALLCSVVLSAWPATAEVAAQEPTPIDALSARRDPGEVDVQGCLSDLTRDPDRRPVEPHVLTASTEVLVNGQRVALVDDAVWWARPKFDPQDACPHSVFVVYSITLEELASVGVAEPTPGTWRPIQIDLRVDTGVTTYTGQIDISIGSGPRVGAITSATNTSEGMRLRGWVVDPVRYGSLGMIATVNGTVLGRNDQPKGATESPRQFFAGLPSSDVWNDRGVGTDHDFDIVVPYGRVCLYATHPYDGNEGLLGCRTSTIDGRRRASIDSIRLTPGPDMFSQYVTLSGRVTDPWAGPGEGGPRFDVLLGAMSYPAAVVHGVTTRARPDLPGPLSDGSGTFDYTVTFRTGMLGVERLCLRDVGNTMPHWWMFWTPEQRGTDLACREVFLPSRVPGPPIGVLDDVDVHGRRATVTGWAVDPNGGAPRVLVSANGVPVAMTTTGRPRFDVRKAVGGDGTAGFGVDVQLPAGAQRVCAAWQDTTDRGWSAPQCRSIVVK